MAKNAIERLKRIEAESARLRQQLGFSNKNEVVWQGDIDDRELVVTADGLGGATLELVEGNHPVDYLQLRSKSYDREDDACASACRILNAANGEECQSSNEGKTLGGLVDEIFG